MKNWWRNLTVGTKSILVGAHQFILHPIYLFRAWIELYGFPWDLRLWVVFFIHDLGYWGKPNLDGPEGERHVEWGARLAHMLFDRNQEACHPIEKWWYGFSTWNWYDLCAYHSRHYAKMCGELPSKLCFADKLAFKYQIKSIYLWGTKLSGELDEYLSNGKYWNQPADISPSQWYDNLIQWIDNWVEKHKNGEKDEVTVLRTNESNL